MWRAKDKDGKRRDWGTLVPDRVFHINYSSNYKQHDMDYAIDSGVSRLKGDVKLLKAMIKTGNQASKEALKKGKHAVAVGKALWSPIWALGNFAVLRCLGWIRYQKSK